ncbi:MAG: hypothetical protein JWN72_540 [Thermoleophilia bacterium]|nr:hypothetical protein [Thermoleophilia bacterium]
MAINPLVAGGIGAAVVAGGVGFGLTKAADAIIAKHPTGTGGDTRTSWMIGGTAALGVGVAAVSVLTGRAGSLRPGLAIAGAALGVGALLGAAGAGIASMVRHGESVDTKVKSVFDKYDDFPANGSLDLQGSFWSPPETFRSETSSYEDSDGDTHYTTTVYDITRLAEAADSRGDGDDKADKAEVRGIIASFDKDGDGRIKGKEGRELDRSYGERVVSSYSGRIDNWWDGSDYGYTPTSPGDDYGGGGVSPGDDY